LDVIQQGWQPVPLAPRSKAAIPGWETLVLTADNAADHFSNGGNIGVRVGIGELLDADADCAEAGGLADDFLPPTGMVSGRASSPRSHRWYLSDLHTLAPVDAIKWHDIDGSVLCELRIGGGGKAAQTMIPPSTHDSGEATVWYERGRP